MARGFEKPPWWAVVVIVVGLVVLAVGLPIASHRGGEPLSKAELDRLAAATSLADSADQLKPALFLGDSYSAGTGASDPAHRFTSVLARLEGWREENGAIGGTGYVNSPPADSAQAACGQSACPNYPTALAAFNGATPEIIMVSGGRNDVAAVAKASYSQSVADYFKQLRTRFPDAKITATSPIWDDDPTPAWLQQVADAVKSGVQAVGGVYLDIGQPLSGQKADVSSDGVHPNDAGHAAIAKAVEGVLVAAGVVGAR